MHTSIYTRKHITSAWLAIPIVYKQSTYIMVMKYTYSGEKQNQNNFIYKCSV